jgi:hypothetical protein
MIRTEIDYVIMREGVKGTWHLIAESNIVGSSITILSGNEDEVRAAKTQFEQMLLPR